MPIVESSYEPPFYLRNNHLATVIPNTLRKVEGLSYERERIFTPDEDFLDLDWVRSDNKQLVIISHGLEGSTDRHYVKGMAKYFSERDWDALAWNCRSCSGEMNWKPRFYHHGATEDLEHVIAYAIKEYGYKSIVLVGFSMGGSLTLKYLGEMAEKAPNEVIAGVGFSVPVDLLNSVEELSKWGTSFYRKRFIRKLEKKIREKAIKYPDKIDVSGFSKIRYFPDFDNLYTAPLHGFKNAEDFYDKASAKHYMYQTDRPILLVNALNDPFLGDACYPEEEAKSHELLHLEMPAHGGHVGFSLAGQSYNYMEKRAFDFMEKFV